MEIRKGGTSLVGFPALIDRKDAVTIEVFDEPALAAAKHRAGLRRLFDSGDPPKSLKLDCSRVAPNGIAMLRYALASE